MSLDLNPDPSKCLLSKGSGVSQKADEEMRRIVDLPLIFLKCDCFVGFIERFFYVCGSLTKNGPHRFVFESLSNGIRSVTLRE